ncbi:MAG: NAD(P)-dependent oxidoreductase [Chloroflexi bacterium]|nr:NAD(P)-dependent oxidoreductase [Chloroflexota bacterium]
MLPERPRLGFIGFGAVAYHMAKGLHEEEGFTSILAYCDGPRNRPPYAQAFREKAAGAGVTLADTLADLAAGSDLILSAVTAAATLEVARQTAPFLMSRHMFVDMNSASPRVKMEAGAMCAARGATFVDCVLLAGPSMYRHRTLLWVSGPGAAEFQRVMSKYHMPIRAIDGPAGAAAQVKLLRSILMKSLEASLWETALAAHRAGLDKQVREAAFEWLDTLKFSFFANRLLCTGALHARRRVEELDEVVGMVRELGMEPVMAEAARRRLAGIAALDLKGHFNAEEPADYRTVLEAVDTVLARKRGAS